MSHRSTRMETVKCKLHFSWKVPAILSVIPPMQTWILWYLSHSSSEECFSREWPPLWKLLMYLFRYARACFLHFVWMLKVLQWQCMQVHPNKHHFPSNISISISRWHSYQRAIHYTDRCPLRWAGSCTVAGYTAVFLPSRKTELYVPAKLN